MKTEIQGSWKLVLILASLPFVAASLQRPELATAEDEAAAVPNGITTNADTPPAPIEDTNQAVNVAAAPAVPTTTDLTAPPNVKLSAGAAEVVQLAQAGVSEDVMLAYVNAASTMFRVGSDAIVYLNDLGVPGPVVKAMMDRDALFVASAPVAAINPAPANNPIPMDAGAYPPAAPDYSTTPAYPPDAAYSYYPGANPAGYPAVDDTSYFYDSLSPYGSWLNIPGYGYCWQPTVYLVNHEWRPYGDRGRWIYSDSGWYWQSDYSWGWAAFHYGRWFNDARHGWVWAPDRVWGPAWVSWRQSASYSGWAPLPPGAVFVAGRGFEVNGRPVGAGFDFGIAAKSYVFIPTERLTDYAPTRYTLASAQATRVFSHTVVHNDFTPENHRMFNHGIDPQQVTAASGVPVRRAEIRELPGDSRDHRGDRLEKLGDKLVIYRPQLPGTAQGAPPLTAGISDTGKTALTAGSSITLPSRISGVSPVTSSDTGRVPITLQRGSGSANSASPAATTDPNRRPRVSVATRDDAPQNGGASTSAKPETYPPNSLILTGRQSEATPGSAFNFNYGRVYAPNPGPTPVQPRSQPLSPGSGSGGYSPGFGAALPGQTQGLPQVALPSPRFGPNSQPGFAPNPGYVGQGGYGAQPGAGQSYRQQAPAASPYSTAASPRSSGGGGGYSAPALPSRAEAPAAAAPAAAASSSSSRGK